MHSHGIRRGLRVLVLLLPAALAMKGTVNLVVDRERGGSAVGLWNRFTYLAGGHVYTNVQFTSASPPLYDSSNLWSLACTPSELNAILQGDVCEPGRNFSRDCFCASPLATNSTNSSPPATFLPAICDRDVVEAGPIYQAIVSCPNTRIVLNAHYHITNPGGEELSAGYMHMAQATSAFIGCWVGLAVALVLALSYARSCGVGDAAAADAGDGPRALSPVRALHWALLAVLVFFVLDSAARSAFLTGVSAAGEYSDASLSAVVVAGDVSSAAVVALLLLVSRGWQITRLHLDRNERRYVVFLSVLYGTACAVYQAFGGLFLLFFLAIAYFLLLRYMLFSVTLSLALLRDFRDYMASLAAAAAVVVARAGGGGSGGGSAAEATEAPLTSAPPPPASTAVSLNRGAPPDGAPSRAPGASESDDGALLSGQPPARAPAPGAGAGSWLRSSVAAARGWWRVRVSPWLGDASLVEDGTLTVRQMRTMRVFRTAAVGFVIVDWFIKAWEVSFRTDTAIFAGFVVAQTAALALLLFLLVTFRPRAVPGTGPLYDPRGYTGTAYERLIDRAELLQQEEERAAAASARATGEGGGRIVIVNPDSQVDAATGKITGTVAIAEPAYVYADLPPPSARHQFPEPGGP